MKTDKYIIRKQNETLIIKTILEYHNISRTKISEVTGLNKASTSEIIQKYLDSKILIEEGTDIGGKKGGKKPIFLKFNEKAGYIISIELAVDYTTYCLSTINGILIDAVKDKSLVPNKDNFLEIIDTIYNKYENIFNKSIYKLVGISIAIHGIVFNNKILFTPYYNLSKTNIDDVFYKKYQIPIIIENEANLFAISEMGHLKDKKNLIGISVHSGIGAGIILNGELIKGTSGRAGEIGHTILFPNGKKCECGNNGCIEQYCSLNVLVENFNELNNSNCDLDEICILYKQNNQNAVKTVQNNIFLFSQLINNLLTIEAPDKIFIQSPLINKIPELIIEIKNNINSAWLKDTDIQIATLNKFSIVYGGVLNIIKTYFNIEKNIYINNEREKWDTF